MSRYRLLVFDWDGTVMDSVGNIVACARQSLAQLNLRIPPEEQLRGAIGLGLRETVEHIQPGADEGTAERIIETYRQLWITDYGHRSIPYTGAGAALESLAAEGFLMAVATGKSRRGLERDLENTGFREHFHGTRTPDESRGKPHPQMLLDLLDELGARPAETLMIGDSRWDLEMARNAGTASLGVTSGTEPEAVLESLGPVACIAGVADLPAWLTSQR